jgi:hypothetical protein
MSSTALLKEEGNKLFTAGKFAEAKEKYTEAIATEAGENAVLYSNRAACSLSLKEYVIFSIYFSLSALRYAVSDSTAVIRARTLMQRRYFEGLTPLTFSIRDSLHAT